MLISIVFCVKSETLGEGVGAGQGARDWEFGANDPVCLYTKTCTCGIDLAPCPHPLASIGF